MAQPRVDSVESWRSKVVQRGPDECWLWTASTDKDGYGKHQVGLGRDPETGRYHQRHVRAHVFAYETFVGVVPADMCVCHSCDTPSCCNPKHLWLGTNAENTADKVAKGRSRGGRPPQRRCKRGHPYSEDNLYATQTGAHKCKACASLRYHRFYKHGRKVLS